MSLLWILHLLHGQYAIGLVHVIPRREVIRTIGEGASTLIAAGDNTNPGSILRSTSTADPTSQVDPSKVPLSNRCNVNLSRIGYSLYKTPADQVEDGVLLALDAGIRHFDVASQYGTTDLVGKALRSAPESVSITHKVSNEEQSRNFRKVKNAVRKQLRFLPNVVQERIVLVHSPLGDSRVETYAALVEMKSKGEIDAIGTAHFGVKALQELVDYDLPAPDLIQLELSPFNAHRDIVEWGNAHGTTLGCAAWSRLSSVDGPREGWEKVGKIATAHSCTKQQILIRWAIQKGFVCTPRSSSKYNLERQAIRENSWTETQAIVLNEAEMNLLDTLDEQIPAGRLRVLDGWSDMDILDVRWDPTNVS